MSDGIYSALSGALAQQRALEVVANNTANVSTVGYHRDQVSFREHVSRFQGGPNPDGLRYVGISAVRTDHRDGPLRRTGNRLDLALRGPALFAVRTNQGERFTRAGSFTMASDGTVHDRSGNPVLTTNGQPLQIPPQTEDIQVQRDGTVLADNNPVGQLRLVRLDNRMVKRGETLFQARGRAQPADPEAVQVLQGQLEGANISPVAGVNELIVATRSFEAFQRVIHTFRQLDERTARELGRVR